MDYPVYYSYRRTPDSAPVPGMIRMDRALLYIRQQLTKCSARLSARDTKTLGEVGSSDVSRLMRQVHNICSLAGDSQLFEKFQSIDIRLSERMPRREALVLLNKLEEELLSYNPPLDREALEDLRAEDGERKQSEDKIKPSDIAHHDTVFVIMPFAKELADVWTGGIQRAAKNKNFRAVRVDMINRSSNITDDIVESIRNSRLAIVDVTGNNPNVMFELGYAMALDKPNIIISQSVDYLPFDIRNIRTIVYQNSWSGIEELKGKIEEFLSEFHSSAKQAKSKIQKEKAQQGARANDHIGHVSCYRSGLRNETSAGVSDPGTSRARCGRGSSLTLAKKWSMHLTPTRNSRDWESMRSQREGCIVHDAGITFLRLRCSMRARKPVYAHRESLASRS